MEFIKYRLFRAGGFHQLQKQPEQQPPRKKAGRGKLKDKGKP